MDQIPPLPALDDRFRLVRLVDFLIKTLNARVWAAGRSFAMVRL